MKQVNTQDQNLSPETEQPIKVRIEYKDGSWKVVDKNSAWEYENDPDWLRTIPEPSNQ